MGWFEKFMDHVAMLLEKPPYFIFIFVASVLVFVSMLTGRYFRETWALFLYAAAGMMWRYLEKDLRSNLFSNKNKEGENKVRGLAWKTSMVIYHVGNIILLYILVTYLDLI